MATIYNFSRNALLKEIGLSLGKKPLVFFISAVLVTLPLGYATNSVALILFVLYSLLSAKRSNMSFNFALLLPLLLFALMALSLIWTIDQKSTLKALSKEASLLFIPLAFCFNKQFIRMGLNSILKNYSIGMCLFGFYYLGRAFIRYAETHNPEVFFYHELATPAVNAIYLSALYSIPLFYFLSVKKKAFWDFIILAYLLVLIFLLSSKTVIIINVLVIAVYFLFFSGLQKRVRLISLAVFLLLITGLGYYGKIKDRLMAEFEPTAKTAEIAGGINKLTIKEAWSKPVFTANDYFNGTAFRAYQIRIFTEMIAEDNIMLTGYGVNTSLQKIEEWGLKHNVYKGNAKNKGYNAQNFHNQYIEIFADLGIFGFLLLITILTLNLKNAVKSKDFIHIAFAILMIALLLTESFLWRQRGVVFFTMFYCLFNALLPKGTEKEKYEKNTDNRSSRLFRLTSL